jgi:valyl-tRNA synthetase
LIKDRNEGQDIIVSNWPSVEKTETLYLELFEVVEEVVTGIRNIRKSSNIANKVRLELKIKRNNDSSALFDSVILKMGNLSSLSYVVTKPHQANSFLVRGNEYYIPFGEEIDLVAERKKMEEELAYTNGFLRSVQAKLTNEKFMSGAPAQVVEMERRKENDAVTKIKLLEEKLKEIN